MTNRGAAVLGLRLFALYLVARVVLDIPRSFAAAAAQSGESVASVAAAAAVVLPLGAAVVIWIYVGRIANWVLPPRRPQSLEAGQSADPAALAALAYTVVGFVLLGEALPPLLGRLAVQGLEGPLSPELVSRLVTAAMGLLLVLGARNLARLVTQLRRAGAVRPPARGAAPERGGPPDGR